MTLVSGVNALPSGTRAVTGECGTCVSCDGNRVCCCLQKSGGSDGGLLGIYFSSACDSHLAVYEDERR